MTTLELICCFIFGIAVVSAGFLFGMDFGIYLGKKESEEEGESVHRRRLACAYEEDRRANGKS